MHRLNLSGHTLEWRWLAHHRCKISHFWVLRISLTTLCRFDLFGWCIHRLWICLDLCRSFGTHGLGPLWLWRIGLHRTLGKSQSQRLLFWCQGRGVVSRWLAAWYRTCSAASRLFVMFCQWPRKHLFASYQYVEHILFPKVWRYANIHPQSLIPCNWESKLYSWHIVIQHSYALEKLGGYAGNMCATYIWCVLFARSDTAWLSKKLVWEFNSCGKCFCTSRQLPRCSGWLRSNLAALKNPSKGFKFTPATGLGFVSWNQPEGRPQKCPIVLRWRRVFISHSFGLMGGVYRASLVAGSFFQGAKGRNVGELGTSRYFSLILCGLLLCFASGRRLELPSPYRSNKLMYPHTLGH